MDKCEVFKYINSGVDKSGNLKKEGGFKKHFPKLYEEFSTYTFPQNISLLPFKQKLWHFLNDIYEIPKCKVCSGDVKFLTRSGKWGYCFYCSGSCAMRDDEVKQKLNSTKEQKHGDKTYNNVEKLKETLKNKSTQEKYISAQKSISTRLKNNDGKYFSKDSINKMKSTTIKKYGCSSFSKTQEFKEIIKSKQNLIQQKQHITKSKNHSFNSSSIEIKFGNYLTNKGYNYTTQYRHPMFPFSCDFYLIDFDLIIDINAHWTHSKHPFNPEDVNDMSILQQWIDKNTKFYKTAIYVWTELDVRKRKIASDNKVKRLEIFSNDIEICIQQFEKYIDDQNRTI